MPGENQNLESGGGNMDAAGGGGQSTWDDYQGGGGQSQAGGGQGNDQFQQQAGAGSAGDVNTGVMPPPAAGAADVQQQQGQDQQVQSPPGGMEPPTGGNPPQGTEAAGQMPPQEFADLRSRYDALVAELEPLRQRADFYQKQFNERYLSEAERAGQSQGANGSQPPIPDAGALAPGQLPAGVLPPEEWQSQTDMVPYFDHRVNTQMQRAYEQNIKPALGRLSQMLGALEEMVVSSQFKDFKEVTQAVMGDIFSLDPAGKVVGVKDPATLAWIQQSPVPRVALYRYAQSRRAPEIIAQARRDTTTALLNQIQAKPRITQPAGGGSARPPASLDWDTPKEVADALLGQKGLI